MRARGVGTIDDPIWSEPPPAAPNPGTRSRGTSRQRSVRRLVLWVLPLPVIAAGIPPLWMWTHNLAPLGSGDPGGVILRELQTVRTAIPANSTQVNIGGQDSQWIGSCSDGYFEKGWSRVQSWVDFNSVLPPDEVKSFVTSRMSRSGWSPSTRADLGSIYRHWTKRLSAGMTAYTELQGSTSSTSTAHVTSWVLAGNAFPVAPIGLCAGG